jgi:hypothetical protein
MIAENQQSSAHYKTNKMMSYSQVTVIQHALVRLPHPRSAWKGHDDGHSSSRVVSVPQRTTDQATQVPTIKHSTYGTHL